MGAGSGSPRRVAEKGSDLANNRGGFVHQSVVGDAQHAIPGSQQGAVSASVAFERASATVVGKAVELDDYALAWPQAVNLEAGHRDVDGGAGKASALAYAQETMLQRRAGLWQRAHAAGEQRSQPPAAAKGSGRRRLAEFREGG